MSVAVLAERCTACGACLATCPERALLPAPRRPSLVLQRCTGCLACVEVCPRDAVVPAGGGVRDVREVRELRDRGDRREEGRP